MQPEPAIRELLLTSYPSCVQPRKRLVRCRNSREFRLLTRLGCTQVAGNVLVLTEDLSSVARTWIACVDLDTGSPCAVIP